MTREAVREVRFAVVLYGGVSLAIYMNGVSQELLRMVRGSAGLPDDDPDGDLDPVERIYRDLSRTLDPKGPTKFVIDIISGTSAGGINGVALAKALVLGCRDMDALRKAWTDDADIGLLLNDKGWTGGRTRKADALLDGRHMYDIILKTLRSMAPKGQPAPLVEMVDLFVTATDLEGRSVPIQLTGTSIDERVHKAVFRFSYDGTDGQGGSGQFGADCDPMLAFAARCTSSFPVAFPPMRYEDIPADLRRADFGDFFAGGAPFESRAFADGGYLDNRPFSHAIDLIPFRPTALPGQRKLLFIDPFPEVATDATAPARFEVDFLQNARLAATTLPRREVIRDDLRAIAEQNRRLERLGALQERWDEDRQKCPPRQVKRPEHLDQLDLADLMSGDYDYGSGYPPYHHLRVYGTTDMLTTMVSGLAGYDPQSDESTYLRLILRAWRNANFTAYRDHSGRRTENAFLSIYDVEFRLRRLNHLRAEIDRMMDSDPGPLRELRGTVERELARLRGLCRMRSAQLGLILPAPEVEALWQGLKPSYDRVISLPDVAERRAEATKIYEDAENDGKLRGQIDHAMAVLGQHLEAAFDASKIAIEAALLGSGVSGLKTAFDTFHWHDVTSYPFLEGGSAQEHSGIQVFRISPADSSINDCPTKLAGIAVGAFGGFLNRDWREHDILWGRLDGAERIVTALLPHDRDAARRADFIDRLQDAIIRQEYGGTDRSRQKALLIAKLRDRDVADDISADLAAQALGVKDPVAVGRQTFVDTYRKDKPVGPAPREVVGWSSRSAVILSRMIEELEPNGILGVAGPRLANAMRASGVLTARLVHFAMPGNLPRLIVDRALFIAMIAGLLLALFGALVPSVPGWIGWGVLVLASIGWFTLHTVERVLRGKVPVSDLVRRLAMAVALALLVVGAVTVVNGARDYLAAEQTD